MSAGLRCGIKELVLTVLQSSCSGFHDVPHVPFLTFSKALEPILYHQLICCDAPLQLQMACAVPPLQVSMWASGRNAGSDQLWSWSAEYGKSASGERAHGCYCCAQALQASVPSHCSSSPQARWLTK